MKPINEFSDLSNVAVYGTLWNSVQGKELGVGVTCKKFKMGGAGFPRAVHTDCLYAKDLPEGNIRCQVFTNVPSDELQRLDYYEGAPSFYKKELTEIKMPDGVTINAWMYIAQEAATVLEEPGIQMVIPDEQGLLSWPKGLEEQNEGES